MGQRITQVDAFTDTPFRGNPAAVCILDTPRDEAWMQCVAQEMNLSETAFLYRVDDGFNLRWFTPIVEVALCGHATLASAHVLWENEYLKPDEQARFHTQSGLLTAVRQGAWIELNFPATHVEQTAAPAELIQALGVTPLFTGRSAFDYLVQVEDEDVVRSASPDFAMLRTIGVRGVIVTSRAATADYDFVSRFFAPGSGIDEDPVTGSAHCALAPFWSERLGKSEMVAFQASSRGGVVRTRCHGERVLLGGQAVTVLQGQLCETA
jgi:PhzF family phenazine biosynthesis protein